MHDEKCELFRIPLTFIFAHQIIIFVFTQTHTNIYIHIYVYMCIVYDLIIKLAYILIDISIQIV